MRAGAARLPSLIPNHPTPLLIPLPACLQGMNSKEFAAGLGYMGQEEVCHRANICLLLISHDDSGGLARVGCGDCLAVP